MDEIISFLYSPSGIGSLSVGAIILIALFYVFLYNRKKEREEREERNRRRRENYKLRQEAKLRNVNKIIINNINPNNNENE